MRQVNECDAASQRGMEGHKIIKAMRLYLDLSQKVVAKRSGITTNTYWKYETQPGFIMKARFCDVCRILKVLHLNPRKFYQGKYDLNAVENRTAKPKRSHKNHEPRKSLQQCAASQHGMEGHKIIKAMRLYLGFSQEVVAKRTGIATETYSSYEKKNGYIMKARFSDVCRILKVLNLDPRKFYHGKYVLNEVGYEVVSKGTSGTPNKQQKRMLRECCPVVYIRGVDKTTGEKIVSNNLR